MLINRTQLISHLSHLSCGSLLPDIALTGQFTGAGVTSDRTVFVIADAIPKVDPLPDEIGVTNLDMLIEVLKQTTKDDEVSFSVQDRFIEIGSHDSTFRLVTSAPRVIGTRMDTEIKDRVLGLVPKDGDWHPVEHRFVEGVLKAQSILKADNMTLNVSPNGSVLTVGDARLNMANFDLPDFKAAEPYSLLLSSKAMVPVLKQLSDFTKAQMLLTGADSVLSIREGGYLYIVSPDKPAT